ncbi:hypothetical protein [Dysgonomonas hofstadii]|nr:hypothetical protein [Dysgonomonas hofstadii]
MTKRRIKIIILFILMTTILVGGWFMYKRLEYNRESYTTNIYEHIPSTAIEVFNINRNYNLKDVFVYDSAYASLVNILPEGFSYPVVLCKDAADNRMLLLKIRKEDESVIEGYIKDSVALSYSPQHRIYKGSEIVLYALPGDRFLVSTFRKGVFAASNSYRAIHDFIETDSINSFFCHIPEKDMMERTIAGASVSMFTKVGDQLLAFDYKAGNDTISLNGYVVSTGKTERDSVDNSLLPHKMNIPYNICVDNYEVSAENNTLAIRVVLNKIH